MPIRADEVYKINIRTKPEMKQALLALAKQNEVTLSAYVKQVLEDHLKKQPRKVAA